MSFPSDQFWMDSNAAFPTTSNACVLPRATDLGEERNLKVNAVWMLDSYKAILVKVKLVIQIL